MIESHALLIFFCFYYLIAFVTSVILLKEFKLFFNLSKHKEFFLHKKVVLALTASLICQESLFAKEKDYTLGKVSTAGKKDKSDYSGQVNLGYSGITAPKSWQDEEVKKYTGSRTVIS